ncbi:hypothetical protein AK812_SmicGene16108, partial [Symbiodinium microadriaticum]
VYFFQHHRGRGKVKGFDTAGQEYQRRDDIQARRKDFEETMTFRASLAADLDGLPKEVRADGSSAYSREVDRLFLAWLPVEDAEFLRASEGLGNSQKAEVAWLDLKGYRYTEVEVEASEWLAVEDAFSTPSPSPKAEGRRVAPEPAPKTTSELPCHLLRTLEVFPSTSIEGTAPSEAPCPEAIRSRLSLDPESSVDEGENGTWHVDVILGEESDKHWRIPCPRGVEELPPLHVSVRSASGVTRIEIRDERPSCTSGGELRAGTVPALRPRRGPLPAAMDLELQVDDLAAQIPGVGGAMAVQAVTVKLGYRSEEIGDAGEERLLSRPLFTATENGPIFPAGTAGGVCD